MFDGLLAKIQADAPAKNEPPIIALLRRLHAAGDVEGCKAIRARLAGEREAATARWSLAVTAWREATNAKGLLDIEMEQAKKLALLADAIDAPPPPQGPYQKLGGNSEGI